MNGDELADLILAALLVNPDAPLEKRARVAAAAIIAEYTGGEQYSRIAEILEEPLTEGPLLDLNDPVENGKFRSIVVRILATFPDVHALELRPK